MPFEYQNVEPLHTDDFADLSAWHHEGIGTIDHAPDGGLRLHRFGTPPGGRGCMALFRPTLPDQIAIEYDLVVHSHGGLFINYLALRGLKGEDVIEDRDRLEPRDGSFYNYYGRKWGLQSYHVSVSRFRDGEQHTGTSNWRRNPGLLLVGHGDDPVQEAGRKFHIRLTKDEGHCQLYVNGEFAHACLDRDTSRYPIPDTGKFGLRLIGRDLMVDIYAFRVHRVKLDEASAKQVWSNGENYGL